MKVNKFLIVCIMFVVVGCASVQVHAPKEPIKVDISMRLDVYQHVQNDINAIEDIVTGASQGKKVPGPVSMLDHFVGTAYAQELSPDVEGAALRRNARYAELTSLEASGVIGENSAGLVVVRNSSGSSAEKIVNEENADRMLIYKAVAAKNGTSVSDVQKLYAERLQKTAPQGTPIESASGSWQTK